MQFISFIAYDYQITCQLCINFDKGVGHRYTKASDFQPDEYKFDEETVDWVIRHFNKVHINYFDKLEIDLFHLRLRLITLKLDELKATGYFDIEYFLLDDDY